MLESGIIFGIWEKYKTKKPKDCLGDGLEALGMKSLLGIFLIFMTGFGVSVVVCVMEITKNKCLRMEKQKLARNNI